MNKKVTTLVLFFGILISSHAVAAGFPTSVLGNSGDVFAVRVASYGDLFPEGADAGAETRLLVLDVTRPDGAIEQRVVPGTVGAQRESASWLLYSKRSGVLNVIWQSRAGRNLSLYTVSLEGGEWSGVDEIYLNPAAAKPKYVMTQDSFAFESEEGEAQAVERHVLHVFRPRADALDAVEYTPIIFLDGRFVGTYEAFLFYHLNANANEPPAALLPEFLQVTANDNQNVVSLVFGSAESGRLTTYQIGNLSLAFSSLGAEVESFALTAEVDPDDLSSFAGTMGAHIIGIGHRSRLDSAILGYLAGEVEDWIVGSGTRFAEEEPEILAAELRGLVLELSTSLVFGASASTTKSGSVLEIDLGHLGGDESGPGLTYAMDLRLAAEVPVPETGGEELSLFTSESGASFVAFWTDQRDTLWFVESRFGDDETWSQPQSLVLGEQLSLEQARPLLRQRIR